MLAAADQEEVGETKGRPSEVAIARAGLREVGPSPESATTNAPVGVREATTELALGGSNEEAPPEQERPDANGDRPPQDDPARNIDTQLSGRAQEASQVADIDPILQPSVSTPQVNQQATIRAAEVVAIDGTGAIASPVAGAISEVTTTAAPGTPTPPAASDAIAVQTEWLVSRGGGTARLILHPQHLGEISIRVTLRGDVVDVVMVAQEAAAKGIAEEQSERLAQAFSNRDLRMEHFEVKRGDALDLSGSGDEQFANSEPGRDGRSGEQGETDSRARGGAGGRDRSRQLAAMPRILTVAPEKGVDLRI